MLRSLCSFLPTRLGGMGVKILFIKLLNHLLSLVPVLKKIILAIRGVSDFSVESHLDHTHAIHTTFSHNQQLRDSETLKSVLDLLSPCQHCAVSCSIEGKTSGWLRECLASFLSSLQSFCSRVSRCTGFKMSSSSSKNACKL